jgi:hypothetical protein
MVCAALLPDRLRTRPGGEVGLADDRGEVDVVEA